MELTETNVIETFKQCVLRDEELGQPYLEAEGVQGKVLLSRERLEASKDDIASMLEQLPDQFKAKKGGGWSFLNMCETANGDLWTGFHQVVNQLMILGVGTGKLTLLLPPRLWHILPGELPYIVINE